MLRRCSPRYNLSTPPVLSRTKVGRAELSSQSFLMLIISSFRICQLELVFQLFFIKLQPPDLSPRTLLYLLRYASELKMELSDLINTKVISSFIALSYVHVMYNFCMIFLLNFMYRKSSFISIFHHFP